MGSYKNFQSDNFKYTKSTSRTNYNPEFLSNVQTNIDDVNSFEKNIDKWIEFVQWMKFYPDLFYDLIKPEKGGMRLDLDQRVFLRCMSRFISTYGVFPRGFGKTLLELMSIYHTCIFFPDITMAMSAQTRENATSISEEKHKEIIKWFPLMKNEITKSSFTKDTVEVIFVSGGIYSVLANSQTSKGQRRRRINIEESALLNNELFKDALEPVVNVPRRTIGEKATINPYELNGMINFVTTSGYRGSDEFIRIINMLDEMAELKGKIVLGASWELPCWYGRGETRSQILAKKEDPTTSSVSFARNYESKWVGASDGALVSIDKLLNLRSVPLANIIPKKNREYFISADIARSESQSNNKSAFVVGEVERNDDHTIKTVTINLIHIPPNGLNFFEQNLIVRRLDKQFDGKVSVIDINGVGQGVSEELQKDCTDVIYNNDYEAWATINTEEEPLRDNAPEKIYGLKAQNIQTAIIRNFIDFVEGGRLKLLAPSNNLMIPKSIKKKEEINMIKASHFQTDQFIDQVANLKLVNKTGGKLSVEQVVSKTDKDIWSAVAYLLYYLKEYEDTRIIENNEDVSEFLLIN